MEMKELTTKHDLTHLLQQDILLYWLMGEEKVQKSTNEAQKNAKGNCWLVNALSQKKIIRRNEVNSEWKTECISISSIKDSKAEKNVSLENVEQKRFPNINHKQGKRKRDAAEMLKRYRNK